jgi:predicted SprT family Zn-dependent metalloprotease
MTSNHNPQSGSYAVKCDDCKVEIRRTDSVQESAAGGRCETCKGVAS